MSKNYYNHEQVFIMIPEADISREQTQTKFPSKAVYKNPLAAVVRVLIA